jgi:hypothetical protein
MRVMKFAVVLCFTAAVLMLGNYPHPVTVHGAAPKALPRFTDGLGPASTNFRDVSSVLCANCHQTTNLISPHNPGIHCTDCHFPDPHGMVGTISAYHTSFGAPEAQSCNVCHNNGGYGMEGATSTYHTSLKTWDNIEVECADCHGR